MIRIFENIFQRKKERYRLEISLDGMREDPSFRGGSTMLRSIDWILREFSSDLIGIQGDIKDINCQIY